MQGTSKRREPEGEDKRVIALEFIAATTIFSIVALVLYMIFTYRPA